MAASIRFTQGKYLMSQSDAITAKYIGLTAKCPACVNEWTITAEDELKTEGADARPDYYAVVVCPKCGSDGVIQKPK